VYNALCLKLLSGDRVHIFVDPPFSGDDMEYTPGLRAISLGNLTVLYEGLVYDVRPLRTMERV
jgi:hypothetical protein